MESLVGLTRAPGVVLPVVLVLLTVLAGVVLTQMRRALTDERTAANTRESVIADNAAHTALRWCEWHVTEHGGNAPIVAGTGSIPAWRLASNWDAPAALRLPATGLPPGPTLESRCLVEDATCDLQPPVSPTGMDTSGCNGIDGRWRKLRITARARVNAPDLPGGYREAMVQSELRLFLLEQGRAAE